MTRRIALLAVCCVISAGCGFSPPSQNKPAAGASDAAESWTVRELVAHLNSKGGKFRMKSYQDGGFSGKREAVFITEVEEGDDPSEIGWVRSNPQYAVDYVEVVAMPTGEDARQEAGKKEEQKAWHWKRFVFVTMDARKGASARAKALLGG